eukprot:844769-Pleurochrysis_carterae.AAC.1
MVSNICGNRHHNEYSRQSDVSDWVMRRSSCTFPTAPIAVKLPWIYPFGGFKGSSHICIITCYGTELLLYPTWASHTFLASKPVAQLAISGYPSDIAIESDYLAF